jgi:hypothetical protein
MTSFVVKTELLDYLHPFRLNGWYVRVLAPLSDSAMRNMFESGPHKSKETAEKRAQKWIAEQNREHQLTCDLARFLANARTVPPTR